MVSVHTLRKLRGGANTQFQDKVWKKIWDLCNNDIDTHTEYAIWPIQGLIMRGANEVSLLYRRQRRISVHNDISKIGPRASHNKRELTWL